MTNPSAPMPALLANRYRVLQVLGDGGFGTTYLAEDTQMPSNRRCVVKQLKPVEDNPQIYELIKERFQREAAILENLGDGFAQIPHLYAYFFEGDRFYLVEEWVEGETLTQCLKRQGPLPEATVKAIIAKTLPVLEYIHRKQIVHRDIKPDNIILRSRDQLPVLIDFGAVKEALGTVVNSQGNSSQSIVVGTPGFMPSEQLAGRPMFSSDLYSLGMTAIYLLTGQFPQTLATDPATGMVQWRSRVPAISPGFANFLDRAIQIQPRDRYTSAPEMLAALNAFDAVTMPAAHGYDPTVVTPQGSGAGNAPPVGYAAPPAGGAQPSYPPQPSPPPGYPSPQPGYPSPQPGYPSPQPGYPSPQPGYAAPQPGYPSPQPQYPTPQPQAGPGFNSQQPTVNVGVGGIKSVPPGFVTPINTAPPTPQYAAADNGGNGWKKAAIVGGIIGVAILGGAMLLRAQIGEMFAGNDDPSPAASSPSPSPTPSPSPSASNPSTEEPEDTGNPPPVASRPSGNNPNRSTDTNAVIVGQSGKKNVRTGPGTNFPVAHTAYTGDRVKVLTQDYDGGGFLWYQVYFPNSGAEGWLAAQLLQVDGQPPYQPPASPQPSKPPQPPANTGNTDATIVGEPGAKNIRSGPGTNFSAPHIAYPGDRVKITDSSSDSGGYLWYKVYFPNSGAEGWIAAQLVQRD